MKKNLLRFLCTTINQLTNHAVKTAQNEDNIRGPGYGEAGNRPHSGLDDHYLPEEEQLPGVGAEMG